MNDSLPKLKDVLAFHLFEKCSRLAPAAALGGEESDAPSEGSDPKDASRIAGIGGFVAGSSAPAAFPAAASMAMHLTRSVRAAGAGSSPGAAFSAAVQPLTPPASALRWGLSALLL